MNALLALIAVLGVSASGPLMAATSAPALTIAFWRNALGMAAIAPVAAVRRRDEIGAMNSRDWLLAAFAGAMLAAHFATWVSSLKLTSVAAATALVTTQLIWVVLIDRLRGIKPGGAAIVGIVFATSGVLVISGFDFALSRRAVTGDLLAIAGGLFAALYLLVGGEIRKKLSTTSYTFVCYGICAGLLVVVCLASGQQLTGFSAKTWLAIVAVTVCAQLLGHSLFNHLLAVMSPTVISLVLLFEVPGAALLAGIFLDQTPQWGVYLGLALMMAGLVVVTLDRPADGEEVILAG